MTTFVAIINEYPQGTNHIEKHIEEGNQMTESDYYILMIELYIIFELIRIIDKDK